MNESEKLLQKTQCTFCKRGITFEERDKIMVIEFKMIVSGPMAVSQDLVSGRIAVCPECIERNKSV